MKILLTLLATLLTVTALTSSKRYAARSAANYNILTTTENRHHPIEKFIR